MVGKSISFGPFEFDAASGLLYRGQQEILLPVRAGKVLEVLLRRPGEVLSKDELLAQVWKDAFVGEDSLTQAISMVRHALGDDAREPTYIQTIPKRGYRFIADVRAEPGVEDDRAVAPEKSSPSEAVVGVGESLGHYEILAELGAGAMGVVYRARDTVLEREVAIKVLPEAFIADAGRVARFEREAKLLATVSHPNIAAIHSLEEANGIKFPVMELVEGETLDQRLQSGRIKVDEALEIGRQIASALEAAHERGIIHRDLKPANIKLTLAGQVKVLDFGLAKALEVQVFGEGVSESPTESITVMGTRRGSIIGTAAYMSPEQARGLEVDRQADIWAFGCVLYEMLTGRRPFEGDTVSDTIAGVLEREPDLDTLPPGTPRPARRVLRRCLAKDTHRRLHDIADASIEIEEALAGPEEEAPGVAAAAAQAPIWRRRLRWSLAGVVVGAVAAGLASWNLMRPTTQVQHFSVEVTPGKRLWGATASEEYAWALHRPSRTAMVLAPDGEHLAYAATDGEEAQLYLRPVDQPQAGPLRDTEGGCCPFFSPDGQALGFFAGEYTAWSLKRITLDSGEVRTIVPDVGITPYPYGATWGDDGTIAFADGRDGGLLRVSASGGTPVPITEVNREDGEISHRLPHLLPGGDAVLFTVMKSRHRWEDAEIVAESFETGERKVLVTAGTDPRYCPTGHLIFAREGSLMAVPFDPVRLEVDGEPVRVLENVMQASGAGYGVLNSGTAQISFSVSGSLAYVPGGIYPELDDSLVWVDRDGESVEVIATPPGQHDYARVSPDGRFLAYAGGRYGHQQVWIHDIQRRISTPLIPEGEDLSPVWSPDGRQIAFGSDMEGAVSNLYAMSADGTGEPKRLTWSHRGHWPSAWSLDGVLAFVASPDDIWVLQTEGEDSVEPRPFLESQFRERYPTFSPDGRWIAYSSDVTGRFEVYVRPYPGPGAAIQISVEGGNEPAWSRDGQELFYRESNLRMMVVDVNVSADEAFPAGTPRLHFEGGPYVDSWPARSYDIAADGRFVMIVAGAAEPQPVTHINIVLNWFEELKRLVPTGGR